MGKGPNSGQTPKKGMAPSQQIFLCGCAEETIHHLLHCPIVSSLWEIIFSLFRLSWVFPKSIKEAVLSWKGSFVGKKRSKVWKSVPVCIFWTFWKKRNCLAFKNGSLAVQRLKHSFVFNMWDWNNMYIGEGISSLIGFLEWLASK